jgi:hypothetical protein
VSSAPISATGASRRPVMVPISSPQSWNGMNAVSIRSDDEDAQ